MLPETITHFVRSEDYEVGDLIWFLGKSHRITRFQPYTHPVPEVAARFGEGTRFAHCELGWSITMTANGTWPMEWEHTPPKYRERFLAARYHSTFCAVYTLNGYGMPKRCDCGYVKR